MPDTPHLGLPLPAPEGFTLTSLHYQRLFNAVDAEMIGALGLLGTGVFEGWTPSEGGDGIALTAGRGIAAHSTKGYIFLQTKGARSVALPPDDGDYFLFASAVIASVLGNADSRESALPAFLFGSDDTLDGAVRIAAVSLAGGAVTITPDAESDNLFVHVARLINDLGYTDDDRAIGTVSERLAALGGPGSGGGSAFWGGLTRTGVDPTTIAQYVAQQIADQASKSQTTVPASTRDETTVNVLHSLALHQFYHDDSFANIPPHQAFVISPGRGTGDWTSDALTDADLTDMPMDAVAHHFG